MRTARMTWLLASVALLFCLPMQAMAQASADPDTDDTMLAAGFLEGHPDLLYRSQGLEAYGEKE